MMSSPSNLREKLRKRPPTVTRRELIPDGTDSEFRTMVHNLLSVAHRLQWNRASHARMLGITGVQYTILTAIAHLQGEDGVAVNTIAHHLHITPSFITMETTKLVAAKIVKKRADSEDRRRVKVMVAQRGWELLHEIVPIQQPVNDMLFEDLSTEEFRAFARTIDVIARNAERAQALLELLKQSRKKQVLSKR